MMSISQLTYKEATCLVALVLSAAFNTLDHSTLLDRLEFNFGISGSTLKWIQTYLTDRLRYVKVDDDKSDKLVCNVGVPQGSVLGPLLFSLYVAPISNVISSFGISFHQYADDTKLYMNIDRSTIHNRFLRHSGQVHTGSSELVHTKWIVSESNQI